MQVQADQSEELIELKFGGFLDRFETYVSARDRVTEHPDLAFQIQRYRSELSLLESEEIYKRLTHERGALYAQLNSVNLLRDRHRFF